VLPELFNEPGNYLTAAVGESNLLYPRAFHIGDLESKSFPREMIPDLRDPTEYRDRKAHNRVECASRSLRNIKTHQQFVCRRPAINYQHSIISLDELGLLADIWQVASNRLKKIGACNNARQSSIFIDNYSQMDGRGFEPLDYAFCSELTTRNDANCLPVGQAPQEP
jgi:hypothetical protein